MSQARSQLNQEEQEQTGNDIDIGQNNNRSQIKITKKRRLNLKQILLLVFFILLATSIIIIGQVVLINILFKQQKHQQKKKILTYKQISSCQLKYSQQISQCQNKQRFQECECTKAMNAFSITRQSKIKAMKKECEQKSDRLARIQDGMKWEINSYYPLIFKPQQLVAKKQAYFPKTQQLVNLDPQKDLIVSTHAGRRYYLQILYKHLLKQKQYFFEWHLWAHTTNQQDIQFMQKLERQNIWIKIIKINGSISDQINLMKYYVTDCQKNKLYLKMDDDTLWMDPDFIKTMFNARFKLAKHLVVFANIINTAIHTHLQQRFGVFQYPQTVEYDCISNGWYNPQIGAALHTQFIQSIQRNETSKWRSFKQWIALNYERISINAFLYYSQTFHSLEYTQKRGDQLILTAQYTKMYEKPVVIIGEAICVHGAFYSQRKFFDMNHPEFVQKYKKFADEL